MNKRRYLKVTLEFYRRISGQRVSKISDIPQEQLSFLAGMDYWDMLRPLLVDALRSGVAVKTLATIYGITPSSVRRIRNIHIPQGGG
jgi:hypothetical protein